MPDKFEVDEEAKEWARNHKKYKMRGNSQTFQVQLEHRQKSVTLSAKEWKELQIFMNTHKVSEIGVKDTEGLSNKVKAVVFDWCRSFRSSE